MWCSETPVSQLLPSAFTSLFDEYEGISSSKKGADLSAMKHFLAPPPFHPLHCFIRDVFSCIEKHFNSEKNPQRISKVPLLILARNWLCILYHKYFSLINKFPI